MPAYVIVDITIHDAATYERYRALAPASITQYGGRYLARGGATTLLEGERSPARVVVLEFPTREHAWAWWASPEYAEAKALRQASAATEMVLVDGLAPDAEEARTDPTRRGLPTNTSIVMPRLVCRDPGAEVSFCVRALGAVSLNERAGPDGTLAHALLQIGPEMVMIEAEWPSLPSRAPATDATSPVVIFLYVPDVDATVGRATECGATVVLPLANQFWGDRTAWLMDPAGHVWTVATRVQQTTAEERTQRWSKTLNELRE